MKKEVVFIIGFISLMSLNAAFAVPTFVPIQGYLADNEGKPINEVLDIKFSIYESAEAPEPLWDDWQQNVNVANGLFTTYLGAEDDVDFAVLFADYSQLWLGIQVAQDEEMERIQFASVPYAMRAQVCQQVGSLTEEDINANFMSSSYSPSWSEISGIPADIADGDQGYSSESELTSLLDDNYAAVSHNHDGHYAASSHLHGWSSISDIPADIADGDQGYATEGELTALLDDNYSPADHDHSTDYLPADYKPDWSDLKNLPDALTDFGGDTNAATICPDGQYLNGNGSCTSLSNTIMGGDQMVQSTMLYNSLYLISDTVVVLPRDGKCTVNATGYFYNLDDTDYEYGPFFKTSSIRGNGSPKNDTFMSPYAFQVGTNSSSTAVSSTYVWDVDANVSYKFGCAYFSIPNSWQDDVAQCRVTWNCSIN